MRKMTRETHSEIDKRGRRLRVDREVQARLAREHSAELITNLSQTSSTAVARLLARAIRTEMSRKDLQRELADIAGLTDRQAVAIESRRQTLVNNGVPRGEARRIVRIQADKFRKRRAKTIANTELSRSQSHARRLMWQEKYQHEADSWVRIWRTTKEEKNCPICRPLEGREVPLQDGQYSSSIGLLDGPPSHPNCNCYEVLRKRTR